MGRRSSIRAEGRPAYMPFALEKSFEEKNDESIHYPDVS